MSSTTTGTLTGTDISPSKPLVNRGVRFVAAAYKPGSTSGTYTPDYTKNFLYGLVANDINVAETTTDQVELSLSAAQGIMKRFLEAEKTGGDVTIGFKADPDIVVRDPMPLPEEDGLAMEPHFVLYWGFLDSTDPTKLIAYSEIPVNIKGEKGLSWAKDTEMTVSMTFQVTGEGSKYGRTNVAKTIDYVAPTT